MMKYIEKNAEQLAMTLVVKEEGNHNQGEEKGIPAKRVDIVSFNSGCLSPHEFCRKISR